MDLHKLRIFATIAREGSFTRAAETLFMTQPTASQQLAQLETELGVTLIERQTRKLRLTAAGEALLPYAEEMLALEAAAKNSARYAAGLADRTLRLGVGHLFTVYLLPDLLRRYREAHPDWPIQVTAGNTSALLDMVVQGSAEIALIGSPAEDDDASITPFMEDRLMVIVGRGDIWEARNGVSVDDLRDRTLVTREKGSALHAAVEQLLGPKALVEGNVIMLGETEAIKRCVEAGIGVALIQELAVKRELESGTVRSLKLTGVPDMRTYSYALRRGSNLSSAGQYFIGLLTKAP